MVDAGAFGLLRTKPSWSWKLVCPYEHICHEEIMSRMLRSCSCCHWASHSENESSDIFRELTTHRVVMYGTIAEHSAVMWVHEFHPVMQIFHVYYFLPECKIDKIVETERNFMRGLIPESTQDRVITTGNHGDISLHQSRLIKIYVDLQQLILRCRLRFVFPTSSSICQRIP